MIFYSLKLDHSKIIIGAISDRPMRKGMVISMFDENFMLKGKTAEQLYQGIAKNAPIYDFHCHLSPREIYEDKVFGNISQIFLGGDHYKWRAMRYAGVEERYITGDGDDYEKFQRWAKTLQRLVGSPLYHWTNLELKQFFGITEPLKENNARQIYDLCNQKIKEEALSPVYCIRKAGVKLICTTDDPVDDLQYHKRIAEKKQEFMVLPTFRPDKALGIQKDGFPDYMKQLSKVSGTTIESYEDLLTVLRGRIAYFDENGCKLSDHSLESLEYIPTSKTEVESIFHKRLSGYGVTPSDAEKFKNYTLQLLAKDYHDRRWVMQLHLGAMRNNNDLMFDKIGPDTGFDIMNDFAVAPHLSKLLGAMNKEEALPKTILYTLNPKDNIILSALPHCFCEDNIAGKVQFGAAWWFLDHKEGMLEHLRTIASQGMLAEFVGMLTDSRSFLSYARHDYFRRILCSYLGSLVDDGEYEKEDTILTELIEGICYKNIMKYLNITE